MANTKTLVQRNSTKAISDNPELAMLQIGGMVAGGYLAYRMTSDKVGGEKAVMIALGIFVGALVGNILYYTVWTWIADFFAGLFPWLTPTP